MKDEAKVDIKDCKNEDEQKRENYVSTFCQQDKCAATELPRQ